MGTPAPSSSCYCPLKLNTTHTRYSLSHSFYTLFLHKYAFFNVHASTRMRRCTPDVVLRKRIHHHHDHRRLFEKQRGDNNVYGQEHYIISACLLPFCVQLFSKTIRPDPYMRVNRATLFCHLRSD